MAATLACLGLLLVPYYAKQGWVNASEQRRGGQPTNWSRQPPETNMTEPHEDDDRERTAALLASVRASIQAERAAREEATAEPPAGLARETARRHLLGNGFHIPSVILILSLLVVPNGAVGQPAFGRRDAGSKQGRTHFAGTPVCGTALSGQRATSSWGIKSAEGTSSLIRQCSCSQMTFSAPTRSAQR